MTPWSELLNKPHLLYTMRDEFTICIWIGCGFLVACGLIALGWFWLTRK